MRMTRRRFLGASTGLVAGLGISPLLARAAGSPMMPAWTTSAPPVPGLGFVTTLALDPSDPSTLLAGGDVHGLKRTTDAGQLWGQIDSGTWKAGQYGISAIVPHPTVSGTYYALSGSENSSGAVYRTVNHGDHWQLLHTGIVTIPQAGSGVLRVYGRLLALDASSGTDVLHAASYRDGLYESQDGGAHWTNDGMLSGLNLTAVVLDPTTPGKVYVGWRADTNDWSNTTGGVKVRPAGSQTWNDLLTGVPVRDLVIDPSDPTSIYVAALTGGVWRRVGGSWSHPNTNLPLTTPQGGPTYFNAIAVHPAHAGHVLVGTGEGNATGPFGSVYRSTDHAGSWTDLVATGTVHVDSTVIVPAFYYLGRQGEAISAVAVHPDRPNTIWVSGRSLNWYSPDTGANWYPSSAGLEGAGRHFDIGVDPRNGTLYLGTGDWALFRSDPGRQTFEMLSLPSAGSDVRSLCFAFASGSLLVGTGSKDATPNVGGVSRATIDPTTNALTWVTSAGAGLPAARVVGLAVAPSNPVVVYAALAKKGLYKSTDGGLSFAPMTTSGLPDPATLFPPSFTKIPIAVRPSEPNALFVLDHVNGVFSYSPSTDMWTNVSTTAPVSGTPVDAGAHYQGFALDPTQPSRLYLATSAGLFRSVDGGATWPQVPIDNTEGFGPVVVDPRSGTVFAATALPGESSARTDLPGIYASVDGGVSWGSAYVDGPFAVNFDALAIDPLGTKTLWAASGGSLFSVEPA